MRQHRPDEIDLPGQGQHADASLPQLTRTRGCFLQSASTAAFGSALMMSAYCASKVGAESFAQALRGEVEPDGIDAGIAYLHGTGTDMVADIDDHPVLQALRRHQPRFARRVHSPGQVADWLTDGITHRSHRVYAPPWLRWCQPLRPVFPAAVARNSRREPRTRSRAEPAADIGVLGVGGRADWSSHQSASARRPSGERQHLSGRRRILWLVPSDLLDQHPRGDRQEEHPGHPLQGVALRSGLGRVRIVDPPPLEVSVQLPEQLRAYDLHQSGPHALADALASTEETGSEEAGGCVVCASTVGGPVSTRLQHWGTHRHTL